MDPGRERASPRVGIVVDDRERPCGLAREIARHWYPTREGRIPVGDVEIGARVIVERKTVRDLVVSLGDGRLFRQATALCQTAGRPLLVIEGDDGFDAMGMDARALRGVVATLVVGMRIPLLRTGSVQETAVWLTTIARQEAARQARSRSGRGSRTSRERTALDVLGAIPGVGDERARRLVESFGSVRAVAGMDEKRLADVPGIGRTIARQIHRVLSDPATE